MKKHIIWTIVVTITVVIGTVVGIFAWQMYYDRKMPNFHERAEIYVYPNMNVADVIEMLTEKNLVRKPGSLLRALRKENLLVGTDKAGSASPKTGHYTIEPSNTSIYVARMLKNGWQTPVNLVLSGTIRLRGTLARKISSQMLMDSLTVMNALQDSALLAGYGFTRRMFSACSFLIPIRFIGLIPWMWCWTNRRPHSIHSGPMKSKQRPRLKDLRRWSCDACSIVRGESELCS